MRFVRKLIHNIAHMKNNTDFMRAMELKLKEMDHSFCLPEMIKAKVT